MPARLRQTCFGHALGWPHMTKNTLVTTLKALGQLINTYRRTWPGVPGDRKPIRRLALP